jgi:cohesin complex subunit SCC1
VKRGGNLSRVWLAAHDKRVSKPTITQLDVSELADEIRDPATPLALRLSGQLLFGLVRIYQGKVQHLQTDCTDALSKMKTAFRPGTVDLPPSASTAAPNAITFADNLDNLNMDMGDIPFEALMDAAEDPFGAELQPRNAGADESEFNLLPAADMLADAAGFDDMNPLDLNADEQLEPFPVDDEDAQVDLDFVGDDGFDDIGFDGDGFDMMGDDHKSAMLNESGLEVEMARAAPADGPGVLGAPVDPALDDSLIDMNGIGRENAAEQLGISLIDDLGLSAIGGNALVADADEQVQNNNVRGAKRKAARQPKMERLDSKVELDSKGDSRLNINAYTVQRNRVPTTKRVCLIADRMSTTPDWLERPAVLLAGTSFAPELQQVMKRTMTIGAPHLPLVELPDIDDGADAENAANAEANAGAEPEAEPELDLDFAGDDMGYDFDENMLPDVFDDELAVGAQNADTDDALLDISAVDAQEDVNETGDTSKAADDSILGQDTDGNADGNVAENRAESKRTNGWSKRTRKMHQFLSNTLVDDKPLQFNEMVQGKSRKTAACIFYELLVLKTTDYIDVQQDQPYADITISKARFDREDEVVQV